MDSYRAYVVDDQRVFKTFAEFKAKNDDVALRKARALVSEHPVELWEGARLIGTFVPVIRPVNALV